MRISELLLEKNDLMPDEVLIQLVGPFVKDYIEALPADTKAQLQSITVRYNQQHPHDGLDLTVYFLHGSKPRLLPKLQTRKIEDKYDMRNDWQYEKREAMVRFDSAIDMVYAHDIKGSKQSLKAGFEKAFGNDTFVRFLS